MVSFHDEVSACLCDFYSLVTQALSSLFKALASVDELHLSLAFLAFLFGDEPDIGGDRGVVEEVIRELDDGFQPVIFKQIATDFTFSATCVTLEEATAILDDGHSSILVILLLAIFQLSYTIEKEKHLTVTNGWESWGKAACFTEIVLVCYILLGSFPLNTEWWIGDDVIKLIAFELVIAQCVALAHIICITSLDEGIGLGDGKSLVVQFLSIAGNFCFWVYFEETFCKATEHLASTHGHIIDGGCDTFLFQFFLIIAY